MSSRQAIMPEKAEERSMFKLIIADNLIVATKVRAAERKTTAAAIVEEALRKYFEN